MFSINFSDGSKIENLQLNGNNFISKTPITKENFTGKLKNVTITGDADKDDAGLIGVHEHMDLVQIVNYQGEYWFVLRDLTEQELREMKIDARLDYIEMMEDLA